MKLVDLLDSEFLEDHEREELKRLLKSKPERIKWLRKLLTHGPLNVFWKAAGWTFLANLFFLGAILLLGTEDKTPVRDDLGILSVVLLFEFGISVISWYINEADRKSEEKQKKEREERDREFTSRWAR